MISKFIKIDIIMFHAPLVIVKAMVLFHPCKKRKRGRIICLGYSTFI